MSTAVHDPANQARPESKSFRLDVQLHDLLQQAHGPSAFDATATFGAASDAAGSCLPAVSGTAHRRVVAPGRPWLGG